MSEADERVCIYTVILTATWEHERAVWRLVINLFLDWNKSFTSTASACRQIPVPMDLHVISQERCADIWNLVKVSHVFINYVCRNSAAGARRNFQNDAIGTTHVICSIKRKGVKINYFWSCKRKRFFQRFFSVSIFDGCCNGGRMLDDNLHQRSRPRTAVYVS